MIPRSIIKTSCLSLLIYINSQVSLAQKQANNWFFGHHAGMSFATGSPVPVAGGQTNGQFGIIEGVSSISDSAGQLLFYTDGETVWNKNHLVMQGGTGLNGHWSSTQSAIIVPHPGQPLKYYVFTTDAEADSNGLCYSIVDMSLNAGLGGVLVKNQQLVTPVCEKVTATPHCNRKDFWVITHAYHSDAVYAYLVTEAGIQTPVISHTGVVITDDFEFNYSAGYLKASPDGKKLAAAHWPEGVYLMDFNDATGVVSNPLALDAGISPYGVEFSPDSRLLYISLVIHIFALPNIDSSYIIQFDVSLPTASQIQASREVIAAEKFGSVWTGGLTGMQLAPDGKVYITLSNNAWLSVIHNPNLPGTASHFVKYAYPMQSIMASCGYGLPAFVQSYWYPDTFDVSGSCNSLQLQFHYDMPGNFSSIKWDFGDPSSGAANFSTQSTTTHDFSAPGLYTVKLVRFTNCGSDTLYRQVHAGNLNIILGNDTTLCDQSTLLLQPSVPGNYVFQWQDGTTSASYSVAAEGIYWVHVKEPVSGCMSADTIRIYYSKSPTVDLGPAKGICDGDEIILKPVQGDTGGMSFLWQDGSSSPIFTVKDAGIYSVRVSNDCGVAGDSVMVTKSGCQVWVPSAFTPDGDGVNDRFRVISDIQPASFELQVFNRWGNLVFRSADIHSSWDGKYRGRMLPGVYVWHLRYRLHDNVVRHMKGTVTLIR